MPRARTGTAFWHKDHFDIQITFPNGERGNPKCMSPAMTRGQARAEARRLTLLAAREGWIKPKAATPHDRDTGNTFDVYAEKWLKTRRDPKDPDSHLRFHIHPILMNRIVTEITKEDVERVVAELDRKVRDGALSWKSAQNIWGTLSKLLDDATRSKRLELRVLEHNPALDVRGPDRGEERQSSYLFPKEAFTLLACEKVPRRWRLAYALAMYTGLRAGELAVLRVADVVFEGGYVNVHKARDREGGTKSTKSGKTRRVPIEEHLQPLLEQLAEGRDRELPLVELPPKQKIATKLRKHLELAGVTREELFADDEHRRHITFHDLRHTFATWLALRGATSDVIKGRLGHADLEMTFHYIAEAEAVGRGNIGEPFGPLPSSLFEPRPRDGLGLEKRIAVESQPNRRNSTQVRETMRGGRDSNEARPQQDHGVETLLDPRSPTPGSTCTPIVEVVSSPEMGDTRSETVTAAVTISPLEHALACAAEAQRWEVVSQLAGILDERRLAMLRAESDAAIAIVRESAAKTIADLERRLAEAQAGVRPIRKESA